jgi:peroxin-3
MTWTLWNSGSRDDSLRRRFEQNQEDCTFTVLAILPTATENILDAIPVEQVLEELQRQKAERLSRSVGPSEIGTSAPLSVADTTEDDTQSSSIQTDGYVHASQVATESEAGVEPAQPAVSTPEPSEEKKSKKSKAQLWSEMKISCKYLMVKFYRKAKC